MSETDETAALGALGDFLAAARQRLAQTEIEATAGGGMVRVTMDGERRLKSLEIDPAAMECSAEELAELILAAAGQAWEQAASAKASAIEGLVPGGLQGLS